VVAARTSILCLPTLRSIFIVRVHDDEHFPETREGAHGMAANWILLTCITLRHLKVLNNYDQMSMYCADKGLCERGKTGKHGESVLRRRKGRKGYAPLASCAKVHIPSARLSTNPIDKSTLMLGNNYWKLGGIQGDNHILLRQESGPGVGQRYVELPPKVRVTISPKCRLKSPFGPQSPVMVERGRGRSR
jgi:hypothetical protein